MKWRIAKKILLNVAIGKCHYSRNQIERARRREDREYNKIYTPEIKEMIKRAWANSSEPPQEWLDDQSEDLFS